MLYNVSCIFLALFYFLLLFLCATINVNFITYLKLKRSNVIITLKTCLLACSKSISSQDEEMMIQPSRLIF